MENIQPSSAPPTPIVPVPEPKPGVLGTRTPSTVSFIVALILFFLPFAEIKCGGTTIANNTGLGLAIGSDWKTAQMDLFGTGKNGLGDTQKSRNMKQDPNYFVIAAFALGIIGLALSFNNAKSGLTGAMITGGLAAASLIGLIFDLKNKVKIKDPNLGTDNLDLGLNSGSPITVEFTAWFFISLIAFLAAAFFCYKRGQTLK